MSFRSLPVVLEELSFVVPGSMSLYLAKLKIRLESNASNKILQCPKHVVVV